MTIQWSKSEEKKPEPIDGDRQRRLLFIQNISSLARTQKRLAVRYRTWAAEGGSQAERYAKEAKRLEEESCWHSARAAKEQEELNG